MTNNLLMAVFDKEYISTHSLTGAASNKSSVAKPPMHPTKISQIIREYIVLSISVITKENVILQLYPIHIITLINWQNCLLIKLHIHIS
jgi:hypothetical protein